MSHRAPTPCCMAPPQCSGRTPAEPYPLWRQIQLYNAMLEAQSDKLKAFRAGACPGFLAGQAMMRPCCKGECRVLKDSVSSRKKCKVRARSGPVRGVLRFRPPAWCASRVRASVYAAHPCVRWRPCDNLTPRGGGFRISPPVSLLREDWRVLEDPVTPAYRGRGNRAGRRDEEADSVVCPCRGEPASHASSQTKAGTVYSCGSLAKSVSEPATMRMSPL